jgi:hypothetical protein
LERLRLSLTSSSSAHNSSSVIGSSGSQLCGCGFCVPRVMALSVMVWASSSMAALARSFKFCGKRLERQSLTILVVWIFGDRAAALAKSFKLSATNCFSHNNSVTKEYWEKGWRTPWRDGHRFGFSGTRQRHWPTAATSYLHRRNDERLIDSV